MARQASTPVQFGRTTRRDEAVTMTSGRAGKVVPIGHIPLLRGDSASGRVGVDVELAEMPRPLLNGVHANFQAWFVPKASHPKFAGYDEFLHSYQGEDITTLGQADRTPPEFFDKIDAAPKIATIAESEFMKTLGLHIPAGTAIQPDLIDAFNQVYNFRLAAHSSRLTRRKYAAEDLDEATTLPAALWPSGRFSRVVPDYERALIVGALDLDVMSGQVPVQNLNVKAPGTSSYSDVESVGDDGAVGPVNTGDVNTLFAEFLDANNIKPIYGEMGGQTLGVTLADIDKARETQAFARLRTAYAGNDATGFENDDAIVAELMQGFRVPEETFKRPWLLDSARVPFGMVERHATDGASLDQSVSTGRSSAQLSLNVPANDVGGVIIITVEVLPERLDERQSDEWLHITDVMGLPDALRDVQRPEPVDVVLSRRLDAAHTDSGSTYGYEPMNDVWNRAATRLGGSFFQDDPQAPWTEQRSAIWQTSIVDPAFTSDHFLAPQPFPHDVFSDTEADAFEIVCRHAVSIVGLTQIGDVLAENSDDYEQVQQRVEE